MDILQLIDRMEALANKGRHVPLTDAILVSEDELLEIIDQLRIAVPEEIKAAKRTHQERARIMAEAQAEADRIVEEARRRAHGMLEEDEYVAAAKARAQQIIGQSQEQAQVMRQGADEYVAQVLTQLSRQLDEVQRIVRNGLASVGNRRNDGGSE